MRSTRCRFLLRTNAQFVPRRFREVDAVVGCSFLNVGECQGTVGIGNVDDLIEWGFQVASDMSPPSFPKILSRGPGQLRWADYIRIALLNQLDVGIGDTFVSDPLE